MTIQLLLESALRSMLMGAILFAALRLMRMQQVRAQRAAWLLALFAALAMPSLVGMHMGPAVLPPLGRPSTAIPVHALLPPTDPVVPVDLQAPQLRRNTASRRPETSKFVTGENEGSRPATRRGGVRMEKIQNFGSRLYASIAFLLLLRLGIGLFLSLRLRNRAQPIAIDTAHGTDIRVSRHIATPVTVSDTILLPATYSTWDAKTLRIVIAHERAHIAQSDFHVQLLASLHCALFWFNPFSWWLQRRLSALSEAVCDLAAVEQADNRAAYAHLLLKFATRASYPLTGVAMARSAGLKPRLDRLLSDRLFRESSSGRRQLSLVTAGATLLAFTVSTSVTRVQAAQVQPPPAAQPAAPLPQEKPSADVQSAASPEPPSPPQPPQTPTGSDASGTANDRQTDIDIDSSNGKFSYATSDDGEAFAFVTHDSDGEPNITYNGNYDDSFMRLRSTVQGDYMYYRHLGQAYVIQDPALIARARKLFAPMQELGKQQSQLNKQQEALGAQQEELARQMNAIKIPTPDMAKELEDLAQVEEHLKALDHMPTIDERSLADLQQKLGDLQGKLGALQGEAGERQGAIGEKQGKLGEQQGRLGALQGKLGEEQGRIATQAQRELRPLIEKAIRDGLAKPVQ